MGDKTSNDTAAKYHGDKIVRPSQTYSARMVDKAKDPESYRYVDSRFANVGRDSEAKVRIVVDIKQLERKSLNKSLNKR